MNDSIKRLIPNQRTHAPGDWYRAVVLLFLRHGFATTKAMEELIMQWWHIPADRCEDVAKCSSFSNGRRMLNALVAFGKLTSIGPSNAKVYRVTKEGIEDINIPLGNPVDLLACLEGLDGGLKDSLAVHAMYLRKKLDKKQ